MKKKKNRGSAMIMAIIVSVIIMVFALSLLLLSYSLYATVVKEKKEMQYKELAFSVSKEIEQDITTNFSSHENQKNAQDAGKNPIWFYVRYGLWQNDDIWPYFNEDENQHKRVSAYRYYKMNTESSEFSNVMGDVLITMYWDSSYEKQEAKKIDNTILHIKVEVTDGDIYFSNSMEYSLEVSPYPDGGEGVFDSNGETQIVANEKWLWERE